MSYYGDLASMAMDIVRDIIKEDPDITEDALLDIANERAHEVVDGSSWIIYYSKNLEVLEMSHNPDAIEDVGAEETLAYAMKGGGWRKVITVIAYYAMLADLHEEIRDAAVEYFS